MDSSSSSSWQSELEHNIEQSRRSIEGAQSVASDSASTIFESVRSDEDSTDLEEASEVSNEEASVSSEEGESEAEDDEMDDDENDETESSGSYPIIALPDESSVVSGLTDADMDFDVSRLTLLRDELNVLKQRAISEGDELSKEELIRCLQRLENIQKDVLKEADERKEAEQSVASEVDDSYRHQLGEEEEPSSPVRRPLEESQHSKSSFSSNWDTDPETPAAAEEELTPKTMRRQLSDSLLKTVTESPKVVEENKTPRKVKKIVSPEKISEAATPRRNNKSRKSEFASDAPSAKKKKKRKPKEIKRLHKRSEVAADDDDATAEVKAKKKPVDKTKKKQKTNKEKKGTTKTKKTKKRVKKGDQQIKTERKFVDQSKRCDDGQLSDSDKTPRRRTGALSVAKRNSARLLKTMQSELTEQIEASRRSRRSSLVVPQTDPNATKRRTISSLMNIRNNTTPSPVKSPKSKALKNSSLGIFVSPPTPPSTPPAVKAKPKVPETDPSAGNRKKLSRFLSVRGRDGDTDSTGPLRGASHSPKLSGKQDLEKTDHAVIEPDGSGRKQRSLKGLFKGLEDSPSSMSSQKKASFRGGISPTRKSAQEEANINATDHAVTETSTRSRRTGGKRTPNAKKSNQKEGFEKVHEIDLPPSKEDSTRKKHQRRSSLGLPPSKEHSAKKKYQRRSSLGRLFNGLGSVHTQSSSLKVSTFPPDSDNISSPSDVQRKPVYSVPQTDPSAAKRRSIGRIFYNARTRSKSPSHHAKKPASYSTAFDTSSPSSTHRPSIASGTSGTSETDSWKQRNFRNLFKNRARSRSPASRMRLDDVDVSSPPDNPKSSFGGGVPETDPNAAARRSLGRLFNNNGPPSPQSRSSNAPYSRSSVRTTRTSMMRGPTHSVNPRRATSLRTERTTMSVNEPSPTGLHYRHRRNRPSDSSRSRRSVDNDLGTEPAAAKQGFPSYSHIRSKSGSSSPNLGRPRSYRTVESPSPRPTKGRKARRPSFVPKTAPFAPKSHVPASSIPNVPDLFDSGDEDDDLMQSKHSQSRHSMYSMMDSSGHIKSMDASGHDLRTTKKSMDSEDYQDYQESIWDDQLDLDNATNLDTGGKGGRKSRRGGKMDTPAESESPGQHSRKKNSGDKASRASARGKARREHLLSQGRDVPKDPSNSSFRMPRRNRSTPIPKKSRMFNDDKEGRTAPTGNDETYVGENRNGSSRRSMRSIHKMVSRMRRKSTDPIDC